jgi:hypothetical protein
VAGPLGWLNQSARYTGGSLVRRQAQDDPRGGANASGEVGDLGPTDPVTGVTRILTEAGSEESFYIDPSDDWRLLEDGSWASLDERMRSWPLAGPKPAEPD